MTGGGRGAAAQLAGLAKTGRTGLGTGGDASVGGGGGGVGEAFGGGGVGEGGGGVGEAGGVGVGVGPALGEAAGLGDGEGFGKGTVGPVPSGGCPTPALSGAWPGPGICATSRPARVAGAVGSTRSPHSASRNAEARDSRNRIASTARSRPMGPGAPTSKPRRRSALA